MNSKIKTWEWITLIIATLAIDVVQVILTFFVVGIVINRFIDIAVGFGLPIYFWVRGVSMLDAKKIAAAVLAGLLEEMGLGGDDGLPLWTAEVIVIWVIVTGEKKLANNPLASKAMNLARQVNNARSPVNNNGIRQPETQTATSGGVNNSNTATPGNGHITMNMRPLNVDGVRIASSDQNKTSSANTNTSTVNWQSNTNNIVPRQIKTDEEVLSA